MVDDAMDSTKFAALYNLHLQGTKLKKANYYFADVTMIPFFLNKLQLDLKATT